MQLKINEKEAVYSPKDDDGDDVGRAGELLMAMTQWC